MISHIVREVFPFGVPRIERGPKDPTHSVFGKKLRTPNTRWQVCLARPVGTELEVTFPRNLKKCG